MPRRLGRVTEAEIAIAVLKIASIKPDGVATFYRLKREIPDYLALSTGDRAQSLTRPNEEVWEQLIRNIKSHYESPENVIYQGYAEHVPRVGYRITNAGRRFLETR